MRIRHLVYLFYYVAAMSPPTLEQDNSKIPAMCLHITLPKKIVLVTADWDNARKYVEPVCKGVAAELGVELEIRNEDYGFLVEYGEKDDFGGVEIPQVFVVDGQKVIHVFTRIPLTAEGKPDIKSATEMLKKALTNA
ncbi:MAG: hypothetical protein QW613_01190 [Thermoprotei archaeon]